MPERGVTLKRERNQRVSLPQRGDVFRVKITASEAVMMPSHVFGFQRHPADAMTGGFLEEFMFVCSPFDSTVYPVNAPGPTQPFPQFYRKNVIDVLVPSSEVAEQLWADVLAEVKNLVASYNRLDVLGPGEQVRCGGDEPSSLSESSDSAGG